MTTSPVSHKAGYHHGSLSSALVQAGLQLARTGGADAVVLREASRMAGVNPRAAYRHFADKDALVHAVAAAALAEAADVIATRVAGATTPRQVLEAVGDGYLDFALAEPGWFDVAFFALADMGAATDGSAAGRGGRSPFELLGDALDALVDDGSLAPERRPGADVFCWSSVHGFAVLATRGPLRELPRDAASALGSRVVRLAVDGVLARD